MSLVNNKNADSPSVSRYREHQAARYTDLANQFHDLGEREIERAFRTLAEDSTYLSKSWQEKLSGLHNGNLSELARELMQDKLSAPEANHRFLNGYNVWSFAVFEEMTLFDRLTSGTANVKDATVRKAIFDLAREALEMASQYRMARRIAYHSDKLHQKQAEFPRLQRIVTHLDFAVVALAIERWFLAFITELSIQTEELKTIAETTKASISDLQKLIGPQEIPKRLKRPLDRLGAPEAKEFANAIPKTRRLQRIAVEAERIFDFYDRIFETSPDQQIMVEAQRMTAAALRRLNIIRTIQLAAKD